MTGNSPREVVERYFGHLAAGDGRAAFALMAPDVRYRVAGSTPISGERVGVSAMLEHTIRPFVGRLRGGAIQLHPSELIAEGERVVALAVSEAEALDGRPYRNEYAIVFRVQDGQITEVLEFLDTVLVETVVFGKALSDGV